MLYYCQDEGSGEGPFKQALYSSKAGINIHSEVLVKRHRLSKSLELGDIMILSFIVILKCRDNHIEEKFSVL